MSLLDRARRFASVARSALVIVPLAGSISAQAATLSFSDPDTRACGFAFCDSGRSGTADWSHLPEVNGVRGMDLIGSAGASGEVHWVSFISASLRWSGNIIASPPLDPVTLSILWDLGGRESEGILDIIGYRTSIRIDDYMRNTEVLFPTPVHGFSTRFREFVTITPQPGAPYRISLDILTGDFPGHAPEDYAAFSGGGRVLITALNVPEPSSFALVLGSAGVLVLLARRKRAGSNARH